MHGASTAVDFLVSVGSDCDERPTFFPEVRGVNIASSWVSRFIIDLAWCDSLTICTASVPLYAETDRVLSSCQNPARLFFISVISSIYYIYIIKRGEEFKRKWHAENKINVPHLLCSFELAFLISKIDWKTKGKRNNEISACDIRICETPKKPPLTTKCCRVFENFHL